MVFSSLEFLFLYLAVTLPLYFIVPFKYRNIVLLIVSLIFYGWGEPVYVFLMMFSILVDYTCGYGVTKAREKNNANSEKIAKIFVFATVIINLSILGFFKYSDFFINNLRLIPFMSFLHPLNLRLPIGISFYTFQTMSYTLDIYMGSAKMQKNITSFGAYVTLFPQLIAGPIVRYRDIGKQLTDRKESVALFAGGVRTFICGMCKKVLFANTAGAIWTYIKGLPSSEITVVGAWIGIIAFSFQIYYDFSGYSDMAIGIGKMLGFRFLENFNYPYISKSITEFWRRWHISLSTWFKEYVYIPLGGNRKGLLKQYRNIAIVWFLTGLWHGAHWNYIIWGAYFGVILMLEKGFLLKVMEKVPVFLNHVYAVILIVLGWLIFTFEDSHRGLIHLGRMFGISVKRFVDYGAIYDLLHYLPFFVLAVVGSTPLPKKLFYKFFNRDKEDTSKSITVFRIAAPVVSAALFLICVAFLVDSSYNPFLYFRF